MGEAGFCTVTLPTNRCKYHFHSPRLLNHTCSFPARLKTSSIGNPPSANLFLCSAHKGSNNDKSAPATGFGKKKKRKVEDDPWESFFQQLEKDLENDTNDSIEEDITEEDVANFEKELDTLLLDIDNAAADNDKANDSIDTPKLNVKDLSKDDDHILLDDKKGIDTKQNNKDVLGKVLVEAGKDDDDDAEEEAEFELVDDADEDLSDDDFEEPRTVNLQKWQLRKLAAAVECGRRKVHIKSLAAELKLDRDDVIFFLKNPPPELLMAVSEIEENADKEDESVVDQVQVDTDFEKTNDSDTLLVNNDSDIKEATEAQKPSYGPRDWYKGKRIKKTNLLTLQRVYRRSRWPTNTMVESLVQATHLPRSRILEWFEEERARSGVQSPPRQSAISRKAWKPPVTHSFERLQ